MSSPLNTLPNNQTPLSFIQSQAQQYENNLTPTNFPGVPPGVLAAAKIYAESGPVDLQAAMLQARAEGRGMDVGHWNALLDESALRAINDYNRTMQSINITLGSPEYSFLPGQVEQLLLANQGQRTANTVAGSTLPADILAPYAELASGVYNTLHQNNLLDYVGQIKTLEDEIRNRNQNTNPPNPTPTTQNPIPTGPSVGQYDPFANSYTMGQYSIQPQNANPLGQYDPFANTGPAYSNDLSQYNPDFIMNQYSTGLPQNYTPTESQINAALGNTSLGDVFGTGTGANAGISNTPLITPNTPFSYTDVGNLIG